MRRELKASRAAVVVIAAILYFALRSFLPHPAVQTAEEYGYVKRVVDGDTLKLTDGRRLRLIGIDTPELHYSDKLLRDARRSKNDVKAIQALGKKAADFTSSLVKGKRIKIEYDVERTDKYGRTLAYIYLEDGMFVNGRILEEGYAQVMTIPPNVRHAAYFLKMQREARSKSRGLWAAEGYRALDVELLR